MSTTKRNVRTSDIEVGDSVLARQPLFGFKQTLNFSSVLYTVTSKRKSQIIARSNYGHITTNVSHFKKTPKQYGNDSDNDIDTHFRIENMERSLEI